MAKTRILEITKHFVDGHTESCISQLRASDVKMTAPWFSVDRRWYWWPKETKKGIEVVYKPVGLAYEKISAKIVGVAKLEKLEESSEDNGGD